MVYSQNNEQDIILAHFGDHIGTFLDLGAFDGVRLSNVRALAEKGWSGVMVEPSPGVFKQLQENYREFPAVELFQCAVGIGTTELDFYNNENAVATLLSNEMERWKGVEQFTQIKVQCVEVNELINKSKYQKFDFVSCDIEGADLDVIQRLDFEKLETSLICVEWNGKNKSFFDSIMNSFGFSVIHSNAENLIYSR